MKKKVLLLLLVTILAPSIFSVTFAGDAPTGTLTVAMLFDTLDVMDPIRLTNNCKMYMSLFFDSLIGVYPDGKVSADLSLAHKWEMSPDAKTWTFHLRKGIKFHNGDELTAEDVKFSLERVIGPSGISTYGSYFKNLIDRIEILDPYTVRIHCKNADPLLYLALSDVTGAEGFILPKKYLEKVGDAYFAHHPIGTGPYKVIEVKGGSEIKLEAAFDSHWVLGPVKYKYVVFKQIEEELTRIGMVKAGEADIALINPPKVEGLKAEGYTIVYDPAASCPFVGFAEQWNEKNPVHDKRVRQALALAVNGKEIHEHLFYGVGKLAGTHSTLPGALGYVERAPYGYDPEKAKKLLKEAGYPDGFEIKLHSFPAGWFPGFPKTLEAIDGYLAKIGVKAKIVPYSDYKAYRMKYIAHELEGGIVGNATSWKMNPLPAHHLWWHSSCKLSYTHIPELDKWIDRAKTTLDQAERIDLIQRIDQYVYDNCLYLWALQMDIPFVITNKLEPWELGVPSWDINLRRGVVMR